MVTSGERNWGIKRLKLNKLQRYIIQYREYSQYFIITKWNSEKAMAPHSSILAWKIPWMEEPGRLQSMGSQRVGHD